MAGHGVKSLKSRGVVKRDSGGFFINNSDGSTGTIQRY